MNAENRDAADLAIDQFEASYGAKYAKAVDKVLKDRDVLLTHFEFPAEHWIHWRTTNVIESTFATVKLRTRKTKGAGSRAAGLAMAYKLLEAAQARWRCVNAPHLVLLLDMVDNSAGPGRPARAGGGTAPIQRGRRPIRA